MKNYFFLLALCAIMPAHGMFRHIKNAPKFLGLMQMRQRNHGKLTWPKKEAQKKNGIVEVPLHFFKALIQQSFADEVFLINRYLEDTSEQNIKFLQVYISCISNINQKDSKEGLTLLMMAASVGNLAIVDSLLKNQRLNINEQDNCGRTALMWAAKSGYTQIVEKLLDQPSTNIQIKCNKAMDIVGYLNFYFVEITPKIRQQLIDRGVAKWKLEEDL